jgi:ribose transport system permease protein
VRTGTVESGTEVMSVAARLDGEITPARAGLPALRHSFGIDRWAGIYLSIGLMSAFSLLLPATFATSDNLRSILSGAAITGIISLGATVALVTNMLDASLAATMTLSISLVGVLQSEHQINAALAVLLTLVAGATVGAVNAFVITYLNVPAIVATLGSGSVVFALTYWIGRGNTIVQGISSDFKLFGSTTILTIPVTVIYLFALAGVLLYLLEHTVRGRYFYAIGMNIEAARLSGIRVRRLQWQSLITSSLLAATAGIVLTMQLGAAPFGAGNPYLLPAFAIAFLGSTQVTPGRFNVRGTLVGLYLLAIGVKGFQLLFPAAPWIKDMFEGVALIVAVAVGARTRVRRRRHSGRPSRRELGAVSSAAAR